MPKPDIETYGTAANNAISDFKYVQNQLIHTYIQPIS